MSPNAHTYAAVRCALRLPAYCRDSPVALGHTTARLPTCRRPKRMLTGPTAASSCSILRKRTTTSNTLSFTAARNPCTRAGLLNANTCQPTRSAQRKPPCVGPFLLRLPTAPPTAASQCHPNFAMRPIAHTQCRTTIPNSRQQPRRCSHWAYLPQTAPCRVARPLHRGLRRHAGDLGAGVPQLRRQLGVVALCGGAHRPGGAAQHPAAQLAQRPVPQAGEQRGQAPQGALDLRAGGAGKSDRRKRASSVLLTYGGEAGGGMLWCSGHSG